MINVLTARPDRLRGSLGRRDVAFHEMHRCSARFYLRRCFGRCGVILHVIEHDLLLGPGEAERDGAPDTAAATSYEQHGSAPRGSRVRRYLLHLASPIKT